MPPMIVHGDCWIANILWEADKLTRAPTSNVLALVDWQWATPGNGIEDVARFLFSSVEGQLRRAHEVAILDFYYTKLTHYYGTTLPFTRDTISESYKIGITFPMMFTLFGFPMWATIEAIVGTRGDSTYDQRVGALMQRAKCLMEDYLMRVE
jgi:hypothetical protein